MGLAPIVEGDGPLIGSGYDAGSPVHDEGDEGDEAEGGHDEGLIIDELLVGDGMAGADELELARTGWRIERVGPPGSDGKGRYWQWRRGAGKGRQSSYGGKVDEIIGSEQWREHRPGRGGRRA